MDVGYFDRTIYNICIYTYIIIYIYIYIYIGNYIYIHIYKSSTSQDHAFEMAQLTAAGLLAPLTLVLLSCVTVKR